MSEAQVDAGLQIGTVVAEVQEDGFRVEPGRKARGSQNRAAVISDMDDVLTPAQRPGKMVWADVQKRGPEGSSGKGSVKGGPRGAYEDQGSIRRKGERGVAVKENLL